MRLTSILGLAVAVATVLTNVSATSEYERSIVSANASPDLVSGIETVLGGGKRSLRSASSVDTEEEGEERISWNDLVKSIPGTAAKKLSKENKAMEKLRSTHEAYKRQYLEPRDVFNALREKGYTKDKAMKYGLRYESYLASAA